VRAQLWPLFALSAWTEPATVVAGSTVEGATLASVHSVGLGSTSFVMAGTKCQGEVLASVRSVGVGLDRQCVSGHDR
jgi:hypothetical protein